MKDRIFEIQQENYDSDHPVRSFDKSAIEIADMVKAFVEWLMLTDNDFYPQIDDNGKPCYWEYNESKVVSFDYVFEYWFNNIKDKEI
jgi:hypothetical protein